MIKQLGKILIIFIIIIMLIEFAFIPNISNAAFTMTPEMLNGITGVAGGLVSIIRWIPKLLMTGLSYFANYLIYNLVDNQGGIEEPAVEGQLTAFDIFFNRYKLLDINYFNVDGGTTVTKSIRENVAIWYYTLRNISVAILLVILVYVGIRMAISTVASDKAKYKKMLIDWFISLVLIFVLQYIAIFIIYINDSIVDSLEVLSGSVVSDGIEKTYNKIIKLAAIGVGIPGITAVIVYVAMNFMTFAFFISYLNRMIKVGFLILISPLITITYSIDKMKDRKAQALNTWFKEYIFTILIQPFHCIMYLTFTNAAFELLDPFLDNAGEGLGATLQKTFLGSADYNLLAICVLVIISLVFIKQAENVLRQIFGFTDDNKNTSLGAGMAMGVMAVRNAKNIGRSTRVGFNKTKDFVKDSINAVPHDLKQFISNKDIGKMEKETTKAIEGEIKNASIASENITSTNEEKSKRNIKGAKKSSKTNGKTGNKKYKGNKLSKAISDYGRKSIGQALGGLAAIAALVDEDGALTAYTEGKAVSEGVDEFLETGEGALASHAEYDNSSLDEMEYNELVKSYDPEAAIQAVEDAGLDSIDEFREKSYTDSMINGGKGYVERYNDSKKRISELENEKQEKGSLDANKERELSKLQREVVDLEKLANAEEKLYYKDKIDDFYTIEAAAERALRRSTGPSKSEINKAKQELIQTIRKIYTDSKANGGNRANSRITEKESKNAKNIEQEIENILSQRILKNERLDEVQMNEIIDDYLGISEEDSPELYNETMEKMENLKKIILEQNVAQKFQITAEMQGSAEKLANKMGRKTIKRMTKG